MGGDSSFVLPRVLLVQMLGAEQYSLMPVAMLVPGCAGECSQATWNPVTTRPGWQLKGTCGRPVGPEKATT